MHARVGPTRDGEAVEWSPNTDAERGAHLALDGAQLGLRRPAVEAGAVVLDG